MAPPSDARPAIAIQVGRTRLQGRTAALVLLFAVAVIAAFLVWLRPTLRMSLAATLWIAFVVYWSAAARHAAPTVQAESPASRAWHSRLLNFSLLLLFLPVPWLRARFLPLTPVTVAVGLGVQALGFLLAAWARRHLGRNWSGPVSVVVDHQLVRSGPYRLVRHPIYAAMLVMYAGVCLVSGELHALAGLAMLIGAYCRKIPQEERAMRDAFGRAYDEYRRNTWAVVPGLP